MFSPSETKMRVTPLFEFNLKSTLQEHVGSFEIMAILACIKSDLFEGHGVTRIRLYKS